MAEDIKIEESDKLATEDTTKKRLAKPDSIQFRCHYVQKRRKDRKEAIVG